MLSNTIELAVAKLLANQIGGSYWKGDIYFNLLRTAMYIPLLYYLGYKDERRMSQAIFCLLNYQSEDGSWSELDDRGSPELGVTGMAMLSIDLALEHNLTPHVNYQDLMNAKRKVQQYIESNSKEFDFAVRTYFYSGLPLFYALYGRIGWDIFEGLPFESYLLPKSLRIGPRRAPAWARKAILPVVVICGNRLHFRNRIRDFLKKYWCRKVEQELLETQGEDGRWFTFRVDAFGAIALYIMGFRIGDSLIDKLIVSFNERQDDSGYVHGFNLPVWDTAFSLTALKKAGQSEQEPRIKNAIRWLEKLQRADGSWPFYNNSSVPSDNDDTAVASVALSLFSSLDSTREPDRHAVDWLLSRQNRDGGWASFEMNQSVKNRPGPIIPSKGRPVSLFDPSTADVTGHVLSALGREGLDKSSAAVIRAIVWLRKDQMINGAWWGRWGLCYIYGTYCVLEGLKAVREDMTKDYVRTAVKWLKEVQNNDGGWGETYQSYYDPEFAGKGPSTAEHTSWALLGLIFADENIESSNIISGINWLLRNQNNGIWEPSYNAGAIGVGKYDLYASIFPLLALATFNENSNKKYQVETLP